MTHSFSNAAEIEAVVRGFESCTTGKDDFSHRDHVTVAIWYLFQKPEEAGNLMRASLHRFLDHYDCRKNYHETLTLFWIELVRKHLAELQGEPSMVQATNVLVQRLGNSRLAFEFYSKELVDSETARSGWVEPDLKVL